MAGLSGGSWLTGSVAINNWPTTQSLRDSVWNLEENLVVPSDNTISFYADIISAVKEKRDFAGSQWTGITDYWGRALSHHLINNTLHPNYGIATTWDDVRNGSNFQNNAYPFPIIISDSREPGTLFITNGDPIWEFTPYEFGTWNREIAAFINITLLGTDLNNGQPPSGNTACVAGWENAGWVMGVSSTLFNAAFTQLIQTNGSSIIKDAILGVLSLIGQQYNDVALVPNPVRGYRTDSSPVANAPNLTLVDGGEDGQNIPLWPLLQPARELDVIIANDGSGDINSWPNATALNATRDRFQQESFSNIPFPNVPTPQTIVNLGLNTRPTFFGCPGATILNNNTSADNDTSPLIIYLPNYPYSAFGNTSTFQLEYTNDESQANMDNAFNVATMGGAFQLSGQQNVTWPTCLACGIMMRSLQRSNTPFPAKCQACYSAFCWDGNTNTTVATVAGGMPYQYSPPLGPPAFATSGGQIKTAPAYTGGSAGGADGVALPARTARRPLAPPASCCSARWR